MKKLNVNMAIKLSNKYLNPIITELFIATIKMNISVVFITQFCFAVWSNIRLIIQSPLL